MSFTSFVLEFPARGGAKGTSPSPEAFFTMHGFPGRRGFQLADVAEAVSRERGHDAYTIHYRGLHRSPGVFRFSHSVDESIRTAREILARGYHCLHLLGHSWGGLVACNVACSLAPERVGQLILASPVTDISVDNPLLRALVDSASAEIPGLFGDLLLEDIRSNLEVLLGHALPLHLVPQLRALADRILVLQAASDEIIPLAATRAFIQAFGDSAPRLEVLEDQNHSFTSDRPAFVRRIVRALA